ncbi:hypothetical protein RhiirC2_763907 [Rhizophagus irregularis]|uniref:DUF985 domain-containing protein n=1 Tax=Rhizophagus irregularis TaxID=588596 RepID=A0A2N1M779_9GLOM|nr:hypothetical protein RhiirC2_763907 [Rhizophagus irregularis]
MKRNWILVVILSVMLSMVHAIPFHIHKLAQTISSQQLIEKLHLTPNPEGGYFVEFYRDKSVIKKVGLPDNFDGDRSFSTAIYYLLKGKEFSSFHRLRSDEGWHYYTGNTGVKIYEIRPDGELVVHNLGNDLVNGENFAVVIEKGSWYGAELSDQSNDNFSLVGCTVAPGFENADFEMAKFESLSKQFPQHAEIIKKLTRE